MNCDSWLRTTRQVSVLKPIGAMEPATLGSQRTINFSRSHKQQVDTLFGMAIFAGARPFSLVEDEQMKKFINALDPRYQIPSRSTLSESLLADCYRATRDRLNDVLSKSRYINITVDESTDIRRRRIMNMSVTNGETSYHWCAKEIKGTSMNSTAVADWIIEQVTSPIII